MYVLFVCLILNTAGEPGTWLDLVGRFYTEDGVSELGLNSQYGDCQYVLPKFTIQ